MHRRKERYGLMYACQEIAVWYIPHAWMPTYRTVLVAPYQGKLRNFRVIGMDSYSIFLDLITEPATF